MNKKTVLQCLIGAMAIALMGDSCSNTADDIQKDRQEQGDMEAVKAIGMPNIVNQTEMREYKDILELRDKGLSTWVYESDMNAHLHFRCRAVGYGFPYSTQYTNPMKVVYNGSAGVAIPQADPNHLFSPTSADATWVLCLDPHTGKPLMKEVTDNEGHRHLAIAPVFFEPRMTISPFPLDTN
jgi:hypothetical protein